MAGVWVFLETKAKSISAFAINGHLDEGFLGNYRSFEKGAIM